VGARAAIVRTAELAELRPTLKFGGGPDELICHDLTGDAVPELAVTIFSGGTAGDTAWVVFRRDGGRWRLAHRELNLYKVGLERTGRDLVETQPVYLKDDANCCPSGGFDHRRFHWDGRRLVVVRRWHDRRSRLHR
jgi:hypothetical protein